jgi:Protein of unknown function (DUF5672)
MVISIRRQAHQERSQYGRYAVRLLVCLVVALFVSVQFPSLSKYEVVYKYQVDFQSSEDHRQTQSSFANHNHQNFTLQPFYQNPVILERNCSVTVLFVDPNLGKDSMWALESVVANILPLETTCILLQTSVCDVIPSTQRHINKKGAIIVDDRNQNQTELYLRKARRVRDGAEPLFGNLMDRGNVRMNVLNHTRYNLKKCNNFYNPSHLLENYHFWGPDEFLEQDSDLILMMQGDAVLCHELHVDKWRDVAWVGAPWPATKGKREWHFCSFLPKSWKEFHEQGGDGKSAPPFPTANTLCTDTMYGPQGNGGLGLRSRKWLRKAIEYCPVANRTISGLSQEQHDDAPCKANNVAAEDIYFVTVLRGLGAPLPNNLEAALFSMELRTPHAIAEQFHLNDTFMEAAIQKRWYSPNDPSGMDYYRSMMQQAHNLTPGTDPLIPIGLHKPWNEFLGKRILENYLNEQCPYMRKVVENSKFGLRHLHRMKLAEAAAAAAG